MNFAIARRRAPGASLWERLVWLAVVVFGVSAWSSDAHAYAWMIQKGFAKCGSCHVDPSGGELLTHMGRVESETTMSTYWHGEVPQVSDQSKLAFTIDEPDNLRVGASFRYMGIYKMATEAAPVAEPFVHFPMQADVYGVADLGRIQVGASLGLAAATAGHVQAAQIISVEKENPDDKPIVPISRWHWLGIELSDETLMRIGRINLPFGLRTSEHVLWAREATKTDRESDQQHGVAFAYAGGPWRYELMFSLGNFQVAPDDYRERGYSGTFEYLVDRELAVGVSSSILTSGRSLLTGSQSRTIRHGHGVTARWVPFHPATVLLEADVLKRTGATMGYTGFLTADVEAMQGLHLAATAEWISTGKPEDGEATVGAGKPQLGGWLTAHWLFYTHLDFRADVVMRKGGNTTIQGQLHLYL